MAGGRGAAAADFGKLILRLAVGLGIATHGYPKIFGVTAEGLPRMTKFIEGVAGMGLPFPEYLAPAAAWSEFGGGLLLAVGLFTRVDGFLIAATMAVAVYRNRAGGFGEMELALLYLAPALFLLLGGPGRYSVDAALFRRKSAAK